MARKKSPDTVDADGLNARQRAFVFWYTTPGDTFYNGTRSAETAGYKGPETGWARAASENIRKPKIARAIAARLRESFMQAEVTVARVLLDIEIVRQGALREGNWSAALKASELHGKHLKMFADKIEHLHTIENVELDTLLELAQRIGEKVDGFSIAGNTGGNGAGAGSAVDTPGDRTTH